METRTRRAEAEVRPARGGVSPGAVLTGVVVAFGAFFLLSALVGGIMVATGISPEEIAAGEAVELSIAVGVAALVAQLLAYLWGGYTAGRMGRGAGVANGILVPVVAVVVALAVAGIAGAMGATVRLNLPFGTTRLPLQENLTIEWGIGIGLGMLAVMLLGGAIGGAVGARWHSRLEEQVIQGSARRSGEQEGRRYVEVAPAPATAPHETAPREHQAPPRTAEHRGAGEAPPPPEEDDRSTAQALKDKLRPAWKEEERERGGSAP